MSSIRNKGRLPTDKIMVSARIPVYVKQYADEHNITISQLLMCGFDSYRETDVKHAIERHSYHENRVLHWKGIVLQNEQACNTKQQICNTIKRQFIDNGRGSPNTSKEDKSWLSAKVEHIITEGIIVSVDELYQFCMGDKK